MLLLNKVLERFSLDEDGATAIEYAVMLALIVAVCVVAISELGNAVYDAVWDVADALD